MSRWERKPEFTDLCRQVLDHAVLDTDDWPCGVVDDLELDGAPGQPLRVTALLVGPGAWVPRLPPLFSRLLPHVVGTRCVRVPWSEVCVVGEHVRLRARAAELGLGTIDRRLGLAIAKLPGSDRSAP
ncbi:MAG: hypothetical protein HOQ02_03860 [Lysobacter sp.]|nr:hypothetical protein [Lysobacter sp.]